MNRVKGFMAGLLPMTALALPIGYRIHQLNRPQPTPAPTQQAPVTPPKPHPVLHHKPTTAPTTRPTTAPTTAPTPPAAPQPAAAPVMDQGKLISELKNHEAAQGANLTAYRDSNNILTIGYGHNIETPDGQKALSTIGLDVKAVLKGTPITKQQAEALFKIDVGVAQRGARRLLKNFDQLNPVAQRVVVNMTFNMGVKKMTGFKKMLQALSRFDYRTAAKEMLQSRWAKQVHDRRAGYLAHLMQSIK